MEFEITAAAVIMALILTGITAASRCGRHRSFVLRKKALIAAAMILLAAVTAAAVVTGRRRADADAETEHQVADAIRNARLGDASNMTKALAKRGQSAEQSNPVLSRVNVDDFNALGADRSRAAQPEADEAKNSGDPQVQQPKKKLYTVMIYMVGSNLESRYGNATKDIAEIDKANLSYNNYNVVVYTGGSMRWVSDIPSDCNAVLDMSKKGSERIVARTQGNANMGEAKTLTEFLNFCDKNYPAEHNALILWDHGAGPLLGYGSDEIYKSDSLLLTEMVEAMQASPFSGNGSILDIVLGGQMPSGRKLDFVGFDACLMSCLESMEVWSKYADYYVASQELEPGPGWDYAFLKVLDEIAAETDGSASGQAAPGIQSSPADGQAAPGDQSSPDDGQTAPGDQNLSERITARIIDTYEQFYAQKSSATYNPDLTLNCVKLSRVKKVFSAYDKMARKMIRSVSGGEYASLMKRRADSKGFGLAQNSKGKITYYDLVDLGDLAAHMRELYPQEADAVTAALKEAVVDGYTNLEHTCGISLYFPLRNKGQYSAMKELYSRILKQAGVAQNYINFLTNSSRDWLKNKARDWTLGTPVDKGYEFTLQLTKEQVDNSVAVFYTILEDERRAVDGGCSALVKRCQIEPDKNGVIHLPKSLPIYVVQNGNNKEALIVEQIEKDRKRSVYKTLNTLLGSDLTYLQHEDDLEETPISIIFSVNKKTGELQIQNVTGDTSEIGLGGKSTVEIGDWESLIRSTEGEYAIPTRDAEGRLLPFDEWYRESFAEWHPAAIDNAFELTTVQSITVNRRLVCQLEIEDVNGEFYASELVELPGPSMVNTAEKATQRGLLTFDVYPDHAEVTGYTGRDRTVEIPEEVDGKPVTAIEGNFSVYYSTAGTSYTPVREVVLPDTITKIGEYSFATCTKLEKIRMSKNLTQIGNGAFMHCSSLKVAEIPDSVESIGKCAFAYCTSLKEFRIPENLEQIGEGVFMGCQNIAGFTGASTTRACINAGGMLYSPDGSTLLAYSAEAGENCAVAEGTEFIGYGAFAKAKVREISLPDSLREIGGYAFYECNALAVPQLPDGIRKVGSHAWDTAMFTLTDEEISDKTEEIFIPASLESIGEHSFDKFINRKFRVAEESLYFSDREGFLMNKAGDTIQQAASGAEGNVMIPEGTASYSEEILWYYLNYKDADGEGKPVRQIYIPESAAWFEEPPENPLYKEKVNSEHCKLYFYHCPKGSAAEQYADRKGLAHTTDMSVKTGQAQVKTAKGVLYFDLFDDHAALFAYKGDDRTLTLPSKVRGLPLTVIGDGADSVSSSGMKEIYDMSRKLINEALLEIEEEGSYEPPQHLYGWPEEAILCRYLRKLVIPEGVVEIRSRALFELRPDVEIELPSTLKVLGKEAISTYRPVTLPEGLEVMGEGCVNALKDNRFVLTPSMRWIDPGAFERSFVWEFVQEGENERYSARDGILFNADGTEVVRYPVTSQTEIVIPEGVLGIGPNAFENRTNLKRIVLPASLQYIDGQAFFNCSSLTSVSFDEGTKLYVIGDMAFANCAALRKIDLPPVETIGMMAFLNCDKLRKVSFAEGTFTIEAGAFYETIVAAPVLPGSLQRVAKNVFDDRAENMRPGSISVIRIPAHLTEAGMKAFGKIGNSAFSVDENNSVFSSVDGLLLDKNKVRLLMCPSGRRGTVVIPEGVTAIDDYAFSCAAGVTDVVVPDSVCFIGQGNFEGQSERAVTFHCSRDSYAWKYARRNGIECE